VEEGATIINQEATHEFPLVLAGVYLADLVWGVMRHSNQ